MNYVVSKKEYLNLRIENIIFDLNYLAESRKWAFNNNEFKLMFDKTKNKLQKTIDELKKTSKNTVDSDNSILLIENATKILMNYSDLDVWASLEKSVIKEIYDEVISLITNQDLKRIAPEKRMQFIYCCSNKLLEGNNLSKIDKNVLLKEIFKTRLLSKRLFVNKDIDSSIKTNNIIDYMNIIKDLNFLDNLIDRDLENRSLEEYCECMKPILISKEKIR